MLFRSVLMSKIFFVVSGVLIIAFINYYGYRRFLSQTSFLQHLKWLKYAIILLFMLELIFLFGFRYLNLDGYMYQFLASLLGVSFIIFAIALVYDIVHLPLKKFGKNGVLVKLFFDFAMLIVLISCITLALKNGLMPPVVTQVDINLGLKKPLTLVQLSDVHIGQGLKGEFLNRVVRQVNELNPDIVVITGDFVDDKLENIKDDLSEILNLKSKYGIYYVSGNHEFIHGVEQINDYLQTLGIVVLDNKNIKVDGINLVGVNDLSAVRFGGEIADLNIALEGIDKNLPTILLAHQPKFATLVEERHEIDLILSGHTHGGQIFPFGLLVLLDQPYLYGLYEHLGKTQIYVSSGTGYWGPPLRLFSHSEIVKFNLR